jgi:NADPH:quinone reductase-like Zn-dependent oxidoreductase
VDASHCLEIPEGLDDVTAAAIANPGMSAWAALVERARLQPGETVLINGATGRAGRLAVQLAKYLGAGKVIATGRDEGELQELRSLGPDPIIAFNFGALYSCGTSSLATPPVFSIRTLTSRPPSSALAMRISEYLKVASGGLFCLRCLRC